MTAELNATERETWRAFYLMRRQLELVLERRLQADAGISSADYEILVALWDEPEKQLRAGRIGDLIGWEKSRVSHQLTRMETRGLVKRLECGDDARGVWVQITPDGKRAVVNASRDRNEAIRQYFFDALGADDLETLKKISFSVLDTINPPACQPEASEAAVAS